MAEDFQKINKASQQQQLEHGESATPNSPQFDDMRELVRSIRVHKELKIGASLVGLTVEEATKKIKEEMGEEVKTIEVIPMGFRRSCVPCKKPDRVKLYVGSSGNVVNIPYIG